MKVLFICLFFSITVSAESSICEILKLDNCNTSKRALSRSNSASMPNSTSAALNNPSALSMDRGIGIESVLYKQVARLGIVSGTGRVGAAISQSPVEETFFSHYALESSNSYRKRRINGDVYSPDNLSFAIAGNIFGKKQRKGLQLDMGVIYKRNGAKKADYFGAGATLSFNKIISIGYAKYNDVLYEDNRDKIIDSYDSSGNVIPIYYPDDPLNLTDTKVTVENLILGLKFGNFAIDHLTIKTTFEDDYLDPTFIKILNASVFYHKWIFTYGRREEDSFREEFDGVEFISQKFKYDTFLGCQVAIHDNFLIGLFNNYYLLNEWSIGITIFI